MAASGKQKLKEFLIDTLLFLALCLVVGTIYLFLADSVLRHRVRGAPAPLPRKAVPPAPVRLGELIGEWTMNWRDIDYQIILSGGDVYQAFSPTFTEWVGTWKVKDGVLSVEERTIDGCSCKWSVRLKRTANGYDGDHVSLRKAVK
jgi:hypothetical protein